ncbi:MAG: hypothetical protein AB7I37_09330 [Pirellulales bacterium]
MKICLLWNISLCLVLSSFPAWAAEEQDDDWIDLLKTVDAAKHTVAGEWQKSGQEITVQAAQGARLALSWKPTAAYDFEVEFTRRSGSNSISLIFVAGGQQASLDLDGWGEHLAGIQNIAGETMRQNATRVADFELTNGRKYTALLRVRTDQVQALVNGKELALHRGDGTDLSLLDLWKLPDTSVLGLGSWEGAATFHRVRVRPVADEPAKVAKTSPGKPDNPGGKPSSPRSTAQADDLARLSDEFDDPATLRNWRRVFEDEKSSADQLQQLDIHRSQRGWMTMTPHTSTWYQDYRGVLVYKMIEGDFVATTSLRATNRAANGAPRSTYSLAGIMVRTPRDVTPRTWRPGSENYIFLSLGAAREVGRFSFEVKTTVNSQSVLEVTPAPGAEASIQVARLGQDFVLLRKEPGRPWTVHQRYRRTDMPAQLQVGFTVYTDYASASRLPAQQHNTQVMRGGNPDLKAAFDYLRFARPQPPERLRGQSFADARSVSDADLLQFLGEAAAAPATEE